MKALVVFAAVGFAHGWTSSAETGRSAAGSFRGREASRGAARSEIAIVAQEPSPTLETWDGTHAMAFRKKGLDPVQSGSPARPGDSIILLASDLGYEGLWTEPTPAELAAFAALVTSATVVIDNSIPAEVLEIVPFGDWQEAYTVTFRVPDSIVSGERTVKLVVDGRESNTARMFFNAEPVTVGRTFSMGFSTTPQDRTAENMFFIYQILADHADLVCHTYQDGIPWPEALHSSDSLSYSQNLQESWEFVRSHDRDFARDHDLYVIINPIDARDFEGLAPYWGEQRSLPLPSPWDQYEFNHPDVKTAVVNFAIAAIEFFQPDYFAIDMESNILLAKAPLRWEAYKELHAHVYTTLKSRYPDLVLFSTVQYEHMLGKHEESEDLAETLKDVYPDVLTNEVRILFEHSDLLALSTYPYMVEDNAVTEDYYEPAFQLARDLNLPLAVDQTGYTSRDLYHPSWKVVLPGSEETQEQFLGYFLQKAYQHEFVFFVNFLAADYGLNYGTDPASLAWAYAGLLRADGSYKRALLTWDTFLQLPYLGSPRP